MQWLEVVLEITTTFSFFQSFGGNFGCKSKRRTFFKEVEIIEKADVCVHKTPFFIILKALLNKLIKNFVSYAL